MKVKFLSDSGINKAVDRLITKRRPISIAVAFWGKGSAKHLLAKSVRTQKIRIICDLFSGACNPKEIKELFDEKKRITVRSLDDLHAKVWMSGGSVIVGSANASINGLGYERGAPLNFEASVWIQDNEVAQETENWFNDLWNKAKSINADDISSVKPVWKMRQLGDHRQQAKTLLEALNQKPYPSVLKKARVVAYSSDYISKKAKDTFEKKDSSTYTDKELGVYPDEYPFYEDDSDWPVNPGDIILNFEWPRRKTVPKDWSIWRVRRIRWIEKKTRERLILLDPLIDIAGFRITKKIKSQIAEAVKKYIDENNAWENNNEENHYNYIDIPLIKLRPYL